MASDIYNGLIKLSDRMSKIAVTFLIAAALCFGSYMAVTSYSDDALKNYPSKAEQYFIDGEYQKAADLYNKYLKKFPDNKKAAFGYVRALAAAEIDGGRAGAGDASGAATVAKTKARDSASSYARSLLGSGLLTEPDYPALIEICAPLKNSELIFDIYSKWLQSSPGQTGAMIELAKGYINKNSFAPAEEIIECLIDNGQVQAAAALLCLAVSRAQVSSPATPQGDYIRLCEMWFGADGANADALLALAGAYADGGMGAQSEESYRRALGMDVGNAAAYDGLLGLLYRDDRLRDRYDLLEAAIRNAGGQKYRDMLETTRVKLAEYYSTIREDGVTYRDGIYKITPYGPEGYEILPGAAPIYNADEISYLIQFYDELGNEKEMFLESPKLQAHIADVDFDGLREVLIKRYVTADGMSEEAMRYCVWYSVYRIDRDINKLIYSSPDYVNYYKNTYVSEVNRKIYGFEKLSDALEGHYGVAYGILCALRTAALDFANGEWAPDGSGVDLRHRLCDTLMSPDLESYVSDKNAFYGEREGDFRVVSAAATSGGASDGLSGAPHSGGAEGGAAGGFGGGADGSEFDINAGVYPGMSESEVISLLGPPRYVTEDEMKAIGPDGEKVTYVNKILEFAGLNVYASDGSVKALRVNSRDYEGPRALRIGDTTYDIINKFPSPYFDDIPFFNTQKANSDFELMNAEHGTVLNYTIKNGIIMNMEIYFRDSTGDWKPGTNLETVFEPGQNIGADLSASAAEADGAYDEADSAAADADAEQTADAEAETVDAADATGAQAVDVANAEDIAGAAEAETADGEAEQAAGRETARTAEPETARAVEVEAVEPETASVSGTTEAETADGAAPAASPPPARAPTMIHMIHILQPPPVMKAIIIRAI